MIYQNQIMISLCRCALTPGWPEKFVKNRPKCSTTHFFVKCMHTADKSSPKIWDIILKIRLK
jgi:hypothetical protein